MSLGVTLLRPTYRNDLFLLLCVLDFNLQTQVAKIFLSRTESNEDDGLLEAYLKTWSQHKLL